MSIGFVENILSIFFLDFIVNLQYTDKLQNIIAIERI